MRRRILALLSVLAVASLLVTSCRPAPTPTPVPPTPTPVPAAPTPTPEEVVWSLEEATKPWRGETITMIGEELPPLESLDRVKSEFEEKTGVKVKIEMYGHEEAIEKTTLDFAGKTGIYDLVAQPHRALGKYVEAGWLEPMDKYYKDPKLRNPEFDFDKDVLNAYWYRETCAYGGERYGFPLHFISMYLWWRYDWFEHPDEQAAFEEEYGYELPSPPITWEEYYDVSEFFTRKAGEKLMGEVLDHDIYGTCWGGARHVTTWYDFINVVYAFGGREIYLPENKGCEYGGTIGVNEDKAVEALEYIKSLLPFCPPGTLTYTWDEKQAAQQEGIVAMAIQWDDASFAVEDPEVSVAAGKMAYSGLPIKDEKALQVEGWSFFIPTSSKKKELAYLFMQWAMGKTAQIAQQLGGGESGLKITYEDPDVAKMPYVPTGVYLKTGGEWVISTREVGDPTGVGVPKSYAEAINPATGDTSVTIVSKPTWPEEEMVTEAMVIAVCDALRGEKTPKEALDWCAAEFKRILGDKVVE